MLAAAYYIRGQLIVAMTFSPSQMIDDASALRKAAYRS